MPTAITTVLLDAGGTLVMPNFRRIADEFRVDGVEVGVDALERAEIEVRRSYDRGERELTTDDVWVAYLGGIARASGVPHPPAAAIERLRAYQDTTNLWEDVMPGVVDALKGLRDRFRLGVISNANGTVARAFERLELAGFFDVIVDSGVEGIEKPDPRLFRIALERLGARAEESAYVGDIYRVDVVGARSAGLRPVLLDPYGFHADRPCERIASLAELGALLLRDPA